MTGRERDRARSQAGTVLLLLACAVLAGACSGGTGGGEATATTSSAETGAVELQTFEFGGDFELTAHTGGPFRLSSQRGKAVLLFFGYTYCPDICPTTLATMAEVERILGADRERLQTVFVSVDPERDTPERLAEYIDHFGIHAVAVTGPPERLDPVVEAYAAFYEKQPSPSALGYLVDHTSRLYLLDTEGRIRYLFRFGETASRIAEGVKLVLAGSAT